ncbi:Hypothetical protein NAEGRDRAFT_69941 [Naegleria gruberi]|uniref:F-box domain-containing protein n=1 Tax=Naegleria gruberi TaxID=5762 RepID=D2VLY3_NAEGR|nr:uncharacterized protein NAEGRDRAFT_69941 [Naegleria gruberi]EFC42133.1 Hypothetical protein NAEGRDRAFT_69941 [Naegleria gruberi]|eukprot:XP_002674877.1 Hypothetical protein NAEGRDRAFT_69941 [Naegleria gruberi strain NEG-M]
MSQLNKKRKQEDLSSTDGNDENIQEILFNEMTSVTDQLISLCKKVKLADHRCFFNNGVMVNEFFGKVYSLLEEMNIHRRKVSSDQFNSDTLFHIYQFLDFTDLLQNCQPVSKLWKESLNRVKFHVSLGSTNRNGKFNNENLIHLLNGPFIQNVTSLRLGKAQLDAFKTLSTCKNLDNLIKLDLRFNNMASQRVTYLTKCSMKNLTELSLHDVQNFTENEAKELFNSTFMSNVKKFNIVQESYSDELFEAMSNSKHFSQLTHLELRQIAQGTKSELKLLLKDMSNLEYLGLRNHRLTNFSNLFTSGNLYNITHLDLSYCRMLNSEFANLIVSPKLPKLIKLKAQDFNWGNLEFFDKKNENSQVAHCPPNSQSSLTDLDFQSCFITPFPTLTHHCPNLNRLSLRNSRKCPNKELLRSSYITFLSAPSLCNLEFLDISGLECLESLFEIIFTLPFYPNLRELKCSPSREGGETLQANLISNCSHLKNLRILDAYGVFASNECLKSLQTNPTFSNLSIVVLHGNLDLLRYWENNKYAEELEED